MKSKLLILVVLISMTVAGCTSAAPVREPSYHVIDFQGLGYIGVMNLSKPGEQDYILFVWDRPAGLMVEDGDLLSIMIVSSSTDSDEETFGFYRYDSRDRERLQFTTDPWNPFKVMLNNRLIALTLCENSGVWEWIESCSKRDLRHLRSLYFAEDVGRSALPHLEKIAASRPNVGLAFEEAGDDSILSEIISLFTPSWLVLLTEVEADGSPPASLKELEFLYTCTAEHVDLIDELPRLESLILEVEDEDLDVRFERLSNLRSLTLLGSEQQDLEGLDNLQELRSLFLSNCAVGDIGPIAALPKLQGVGFTACEGITDLTALERLSHLRWISFPPGIGQEALSDFVSRNPDLEVIELLECYQIEDLSPLSDMSSLRALNLCTDAEDLSPLYDLQQLELLLLCDAEKEQYRELEEALPDTRIVLTEGYCLGSGWLLLAIPAVLAAVGGLRLFRKRISR